MLTGIDISEKNGKANWEEFGFGDICFAFIKASEALDSADRSFQTNHEKAMEKGMIVGAYHWLHPRLHVGQQAEYFLDTVKSFSGMLPPVVCLETHRAPIDEMERNVKTFLDLLEENTGQKAIIYTSAEFWKKYLPEADWGCDYVLWLDKPGSNWPSQLWPWAGWTFWQSS